MATPWKYFSRFDRYCDEYLPDSGEGDTMATQAVTAISKLIYKWYNDGDIYDNTYILSGWCNDLSSYANWLYKYFRPIQPEVCEILDTIKDVYNESEYEDHILRPLANEVFNPDILERFNSQPKTPDSIYKCSGPFRFVDNIDEEDEDEDGDWFF